MATLGRRLLTSGNFFVTAVLLGVLFIMLNYLSSRRYGRWDLTREKISKLSDQTTQTLKHLQEPVSIVVFYQPTHRLYTLVNDLLSEYERSSPTIEVAYVDPEQDIARAKQLAQEFQIDDLNLVIFKSGSRHKYLSDTDLADYEYSAMSLGGEPRVKSFKGEEAFTSAIMSVTQTQQPLVWNAQGHGEKSVSAADPTGLSELKRYLEQQNMRIEEVTLLERPEIPTDVKLIIIAGPTRRFTEQEVGLLETYLQHGGRMLALIDPLNDTGLDGLLAKWGVELGLDIVVDPARQLPFVSAANLFVTTYTQHPIVEKMKTLMTLFPLVRSVRAIEPTPQGLSVTPLALTSEAGWGETQTAVAQFQFNDGEDVKGPVQIAVASERLPSQPAEGAGGTNSRTRMVVIGDSDFIINAQLGNVGNRDLLLGAVFWLIEQESRIGISPRPLQSIKLNLTAGQLRGILWFSLLAMPFICGVSGLGMWWLRRR